jgi:hypothetical protein
VTACDVIFTKAILDPQISLKKYYTVFCENPTNNLVVDIEPRKTEEHTKKWK